ncbi:MAG: S8 family peptidase [Saprospiraceae bacterium]|nr:S8 family peptidase [Lewinella sp.]
MKKYENRLREIKADEPIFSIPPFKVERVYAAHSQTIDWGVELVGVPNFWRYTKGKGIKVAVLDTGVAYKHPDLEGAIFEMKDFTNSPSGVGDINGHGTHCAGIIAARDNSIGVIGVAPESDLIIGKVLNDNGYGSEETIVNGIEWAVETGANIISMSLGSPYPSVKIYDAIKAAIKAEVFVICAAGNSGPNLDTMDYPGAFDETIAVGSIDRRKKISYFSSRGKKVDIVAPGDEILSTYPPRELAKLSGTSMATPFVAGVSALMLSKHRQFEGQTQIKKQSDLEAHLRKTAIDLGPLGFDQSYGYGLIDPNKLLELNYSKCLELLAAQVK